MSAEDLRPRPVAGARIWPNGTIHPDVIEVVDHDGDVWAVRMLNGERRWMMSGATADGVGITDEQLLTVAPLTVREVLSTPAAAEAQPVEQPVGGLQPPQLRVWSRLADHPDAADLPAVVIVIGECWHLGRDGLHYICESDGDRATLAELRVDGDVYEVRGR